jgi:RNA polymerase sigma-70 factor (ECF subfamily)
LAESLGNSVGVLIERCNRGDSYAWEELYQKSLPLVRLAVRRFVPREDAEDLVQETFIQLFKALKHYDSARPLEAYIMEIARRVAIGHYRKASAVKRGGKNPTVRMKEFDDARERGCISIAAPAENPESRLIDAEEIALLRKAYLALSDACKTLLGLRYDRGLSYQEIGDILNIKEPTLRVQAARCLSTLARLFAEAGLREASIR